MTNLFKLFVATIQAFVNLLMKINFEFFGFTVSYFAVVMAFLLIGFAVNVVWGGAKT